MMESDSATECKSQIKIMRLLNELVSTEISAKKPLNELEVIERTIIYIKNLQTRLKNNTNPWETKGEINIVHFTLHISDAILYIYFVSMPKHYFTIFRKRVGLCFYDNCSVIERVCYAQDHTQIVTKISIFFNSHANTTVYLFHFDHF